jgi:MFS family permease
VSVVGTAVRETGVSLRTVFTNTALRRLNLAFAGSLIGDWAYATAVAVWAYGVGGATVVAAWAVVRMLLMALITPFASTIVDRVSRKTVLVVCDLVRFVLLVLAALAMLEDLTIAVFVLAGLASIATTPFRPALRALLPSLVTRPEELTAANGTSSTLESLSFFVGPALAGLLLTGTYVEVVLLFDAATFLWSALLIWSIRTHAPLASGPLAADDQEEAAAPGFLRETVEGVAYVARHADLRMVMLLGCAQTVIAGASAVFVVAMAFDLLDLGAPGVGYLEGTLGLGALAGGFLALSRASRQRLATDFAWGVVLWSVPLVLVALWPTVGVALLVMALLGLANPLVDVNMDTLLQRLTPDRLLGRVFGALESALIGTMALGAAIMPVLMSLVGLRWSLAILGLSMGATVLPARARLLDLDTRLRAPAALAILRDIPMFSPLTATTLERLARQVREVPVPAGSPVFSEGDIGDTFYVIQSGEVEITQAGALLRVEDAGDHFGEIALLRDIPRTASATARVDCVLLALDQDAFLEAVTGNSDSQNAAEAIVSRRLLQA